MPASSRYSGRRCDVVNRDGWQCELPYGHGTWTRAGSQHHQTTVDGDIRAWIVRDRSPGT